MVDNILVKLDSIGVCYQSSKGSQTKALKQTSLTITKRDFIGVMGRSGSGKSTLLSILANLIKPSVGIKLTPNGPVKISMVFQSDSVFPWMTIEENLGYSMRLAGASQKEIAKEATKTCEQIGLNPKQHLSKFPDELSGGERRRVAVGMALNSNAELLLLDEPSTGLDDFNKWRIQELIQSIWTHQDIAVVFVTHDIEEAIYLGNKVLYLEEGEIKRDLSIDLDRPRQGAVRYSSTFLELRRELESLLKGAIL